jgi:4-oxalocrotonate tautomerase
MPFVRISLTQATLSPQQRQNLLQNVTDAVVAVEGEPMRTGVGVALEECVELVGGMPYAAITLIKEALTTEQKQTLLKNVTEALVAVVGEEHRYSVWVVIEESVTSGEWAIGGNLLTIAAMEKIRAGENPWS